MKNINKFSYHNSLSKKIIDFIFIFIFFFLVLIPFLVISFLIKLTSKGEIFFRQLRVGKNSKRFNIYKFRTMKIGSEKRRLEYKKFNEADGPVFKIRDDPRFTKVGKFLSRTGLDELPQLINVLKGEMSLVGPRPLPIYEYKKLNKEQRIRNLIKPGITSLWVIKGSHNLSFEEWMELDRKYIKEANLLMDLNIIFKTVLIPFKVIINMIFKNR